MLTIKTSPKDLRRVLSLRARHEDDTSAYVTRHPMSNLLALQSKDLEQPSGQIIILIATAMKWRDSSPRSLGEAQSGLWSRVKASCSNIFVQTPCRNTSPSLPQIVGSPLRYVHGLSSFARSRSVPAPMWTSARGQGLLASSPFQLYVS